jgi:hypothetical protein
VRVLLMLTMLAMLTSGTMASPRAQAQAGRAQSAEDAIYAYTDDGGRLVYVNRLQDVPLQLRAYARRIDTPDPPGAADDPSAPLLDWIAKPGRGATAEPVLYKYRGRNGRMTYTNLADSVPPTQRAASRIDLREVSINSKLGAELDQQLKTQYDSLRESKFCHGVQAALEAPFWQRAWKEQAPLVVCGGAILVFLLITPWMIGKVGGAPWARALSMALPVLAFTGLLAFVLLKSGNAMSQLRDRALPCAAGSWSAAGRADNGLVQHAQLVDALKNETKVLEQIHAESL